MTLADDKSKLIYEVVKDRLAKFEVDKQQLVTYCNILIAINAGLLTIFYGLRHVDFDIGNLTYQNIVTIVGLILIVVSEGVLIWIIYPKKKWKMINVFKVEPDNVPRNNSIQYEQNSLFHKIIKDTSVTLDGAYDEVSGYLTKKIIEPNQELLSKHFKYFSYASILTAAGVALVTLSVLLPSTVIGS